MKKFKIVMLVPHSTIIEAQDTQSAHNEATRMVINSHPGDEGIKPKLHSIEEIGEMQSDML